MGRGHSARHDPQGGSCGLADRRVAAQLGQRRQCHPGPGSVTRPRTDQDRQPCSEPRLRLHPAGCRGDPGRRPPAPPAGACLPPVRPHRPHGGPHGGPRGRAGSQGHQLAHAGPVCVCTAGRPRHRVCAFTPAEHGQGGGAAVPPTGAGSRRRGTLQGHPGNAPLHIPSHTRFPRPNRPYWQQMEGVKPCTWAEEAPRRATLDPVYTGIRPAPRAVGLRWPAGGATDHADARARQAGPLGRTWRESGRTPYRGLPGAHTPAGSPYTQPGVLPASPPRRPSGLPELGVGTMQGSHPARPRRSPHCSAALKRRWTHVPPGGCLVYGAPTSKPGRAGPSEGSAGGGGVRLPQLPPPHPSIPCLLRPL